MHSSPPMRCRVSGHESQAPFGYREPLRNTCFRQSRVIPRQTVREHCSKASAAWLSRSEPPQTRSGNGIGRSALHECGRSQRVKGSAIRRASRWHGGRDAPRSLSGVRAAAARGRHRGLHRGALPGRLRRCERLSRDQASQSPTAGSGFVGLRQRRRQFLVRQQRHGHGLAFAQTNL